MAITGNPPVTPMSPYDARLASLPQVPRKTTGDGTEPGGSKGQPSQATAPQQPADAETPPVAPPPGKTLKDATPELKFRTVEQLVRSQDTIARNRWAIDTHFRRVRQGVPFSRLEKIPNQSVWVAKLPNGMSKESSAAVPNKADDLCNKVEDTLMADPPKPDPMPHVTDESAKQGADLASQFLLLDGSEDGTNDVATYRWALNNAFTAAASFLHYLVDKSGGGYQPLRKLAHPKATDPANPLIAMVPAGPPDPVTGQAPMVEERAVNPILRYVSAPTPDAPAGQFVEDASQADRVWLPKIVIERHRRESVRTFPAQAPIQEADAAIFIRYHSLARARALWPDTVGPMTSVQLQALANWKPTMADLVVPYAFKAAGESAASGPSLEDVGSFSPLLQRRMFSYRLYIKACPEYPGGYWCDVSGANGGTVLAEGDLEYTVNLPTGGTEPRCREIPGVMIRPMQDVNGGDPTGWPFISRFAGSSEASATLLAAFMDVCDNMLHPHVFIEGTTAVDEDEWFDRSLPTIINPGAKAPTYEQFPQLPPILPLIQELHKADDTISGLTATAQGLDSPQAVSGTAKNATIRQALIALSGFQQDYHAGYTRGGRLKCQLVQADFTTPQLMAYAGGDGSNEPQWWTGENFAGVDRIGIEPGTGTMMTPEAKAQYVAFLQQSGWMRPEEGAEIALPGIRMDLGLPKNPFEQAIERSVGVFLKGPPEGWTDAKQKELQAIAEAQAEFQAQTAPMAAAMQAQGQTPPPFTPPPSQLPNPFPIRPNDGEPQVASVYAKRLSKLFVDPQFSAFDPLWQQTAVECYQRAIQALAPPPQIPKGVVIQAKAGDPASLAADEAAATTGKAPQPPAGQPTPPPMPRVPSGAPSIPMPRVA